MTNHPAAEAVASEVRAEMGRQRKTQAELAGMLGITAATAASRLNGAVDFSIVELLQVASWLDVPLGQLTSSATVQAAVS